MYNALFADKTRDDLKEMTRKIRIISGTFKSQMTSAEEGNLHLIYVYGDFIGLNKTVYLKANEIT